MSAEESPHLALPPGTRLLHIGPYKTGTTIVQRACWLARDQLAEHGVLWAGRGQHPMRAAMAAARDGRLAGDDADLGHQKWTELLEELEESTARLAVVSSEVFSETPRERIPALLDELGRDHVHVVITLRPLARILASQWQQYMQNQPQVRYPGNPDYAGWLERVLGDLDDTSITPSFWNRHRHDRLVATWAEAVGTDRLTVVVVDDSRPRGILDSFEQLLGLPAGLVELPDAGSNRSLTLPEVSMLRAFNARWMERELPMNDYTRYVRFGSVRTLLRRQPAPGELRISTPQWAVDRANEIGADMAAAIAATGARVVGDLGQLGSARPREVGDNPPVTTVPLDAVASLVTGLVDHSLATRRVPPDVGRTPGPLELAIRSDKLSRLGSRPVGVTPDQLSRGQLLGVVARRAARRLRQRGGS